MQVQPVNRVQLIIGHKRPEFKIWPGHQFATLNPIDENDFKLDQDFANYYFECAALTIKMQNKA